MERPRDCRNCVVFKHYFQNGSAGKKHGGEWKWQGVCFAARTDSGNGRIWNLPPEKYLLDRKGRAGTGKEHPYTFETLYQRHPFVKSEKPLVEKTLRLSEMLSEMGGTPILIGGVGMRFSASSAFRAAFNDAKSDERSTDVDFALPLIPEGLSPLLKRREIEVLSAEFNGKEIEFVASRILGSSFHIEEKYETAYPLFSEACFFSGEICNFRLNAEDFSLATAHYVESGGRTYQIAVADTALLVATNLKPHAASKKRMKRAAFAVMAHNDRLEHMAKRVAELFGRMELDRFELEKTLRAFYLVFHGYSAEIADGFMRELGRHLPAAKRVSRLV